MSEKVNRAAFPLNERGEGDWRVFERLIKRQVMGIANSYGLGALAEDILQETMIRMHLNFERYKDEQVGALACQIAANLCRSRVRVKHRTIVPLYDGDTEYTGTLTRKDSSTEDPAVLIGGKLSNDELLGIVRQLSEEHRVVLELSYWNELSYQEIVEITGVDYRIVKSRLYHAKRALKRLLIKHRYSSTGEVDASEFSPQSHKSQVK